MSNVFVQGGHGLRIKVVPAGIASFFADSDSFSLASKHTGGASFFKLTGTHNFGDGIRELAADYLFKVIKPSFNTFQSDRGEPTALAQGTQKGHMAAWTSMVVRINQKLLTNSTWPMSSTKAKRTLN